MSNPLHVLRSSSVPDVKGLEDMERCQIPIQSQDTSQNFYLRDGRSVKTKRVLSISPRGGDVTTSIDSFDSFDCKLLGNDIEYLGNLRESQKLGKGIGHQARHILQLESRTNNDVEIAQHLSPKSARPSSGGSRLSALTSAKKQLEVIANENAADLKKLEFVYITPTNAVTDKKDGTQRVSAVNVSQRHFFPSPENDALSAGSNAHDGLLTTSEGAFSLSDTTDSITSTEAKPRKRGPPASLMQRLALGATERRKLSSSKAAPAEASLGKISKDKDPVVPVLVRQFSDESQQDTLTTNTASSHSSASSSSFLARKLSSARGHPYPVGASSPTKSDSTVSPTTEVITVSAVSGLFSPHSSAVTPVAPSSVPVSYFWRDSKAAQKVALQPDIFLFVAHDNPQLGKTVAAQLSQSDLKQATSPGGGGMGCMFECKDRAVPVNTHFILGKIAFSGDYGTVEGADDQQPRGSACIVVTDLRAVRGDIKQLPTRSRGDIVEIDLVNVPPGFSVPLSSEEDLRALLRPCVAHVDMILDPYHSSGQWFPYWEGARRMAPQFRSKGIGYLRLGDDMSQYGTAFLSLDAGNTYLDEGATSIVASGANTPSSYSSSYATSLRLSRTFGGFGSSGGGIGALNEGGAKTPMSATARPRINRGLSFERALYGNDELENIHENVNHKSISSTAAKVSPRSPRPSSGVSSARGVGTNGSRSPRPSQPSSNSGSGTAPPSGLRRAGSSSSMKQQQPPPREDVRWEGCLADLKECVHLIKNGDGMKWAERAGVLQRLSGAISEVISLHTVDSCISANSNVFSEVITLIADSLGKQSNPHVLVATMGCLRALECGGSLATHCWLAWRALLLEGVHSLRSANKLVSEAAMDTMTHLYHCRAISLATLCTGSLLEDLVVGVRSGAAGAGKKGISKPAAASSSSGSSKEPSNAATSRTAVSTNKISTAGNTSRVLLWLGSVACIEKDELVQNFALTPGVGANCGGGNSKIDTGAVLKCVTALLTHREEGTREAALALITTVLVIDALQCTSHSLTGLLELSRRVSADMSRTKASATVQSNTENAAALSAIEASLSADTLSFLEEIRALSTRYCDRAVQGLAQSLSACALKVAVSSASAQSTRSTSDGTATDAAALSARTVSNDAVIAVSPRITTVKIQSPRAMPLLKAQSSQKNLNSEEPIAPSSNASTPPYSYSVKRSASCEQSSTPIDTPRDGGSAVLSSQSLSSKLHAASSAGMTAVDVEKMQQGLQGIKSIRARSANRSTRTAAADSVVEASSVGNVAVDGGSRGSSACRSRRRIMAASAAGAGLPSPEKTSDSPASPGQGQDYRTTPVDVLTPRRSPRPTLVSPRGLSSKNAVLAVPDALPSSASPRPASASSSSLSQRLAQELGGMWYEAKLLLRQVPATAAEWNSTCQIVASAPQFFTDLASLSARTHFPKGAILRHVLPFDEDTSSSDQARGRIEGAAVAGTPAALIGHAEALGSLARRAVELRRIIRVKMADEADVSQAAVATSMLHAFTTRVETMASSTSLSALQVLQRLDAHS